MSRQEEITRKFFERYNLKFTKDNIKAMVDTVLEYELKMILVRAGVIKVIERSTSTRRNIFYSRSTL